ncbi:tol-pal system protein YbgF [Pelomonas sp. KK5]|uniref:tol-pal system protein YbgF n=1 Tax=Pelomonas sp. KK5 TaxID=1855730 RepID=UPI00097CACF7|nr:tol-pal system protein YbgF [Pelomonas sp. KK5]
MRSARLSPLLYASLLALAAAAMPARAALFEDDEARKAILDLRARQQQNDEATRARLDKLVQEQIDPLRRSILDLNGQIESLRGEIAKLRGQNEQLARDLSDTQRKLIDQSDALNTRLKPLEPQKVSLDGREFNVSPDEKRVYDGAMGQVRKGDFDEAAASLNGFLKQFPTSGYADSARFWLGNAQYGQRSYKDAITTFKAFLAASPDHPRAPEAMLALANCQIELKDTKSARKSLQDLIKAFPNSEAAQAGKERLAALK